MGTMKMDAVQTAVQVQRARTINSNGVPSGQIPAIVHAVSQRKRLPNATMGQSRTFNLKKRRDYSLVSHVAGRL
ncbi:hypothetical protein MTO96_035512 [Rhipicephalus appendiculatus]